jgi:hypothetical protein
MKEAILQAWKSQVWARGMDRKEISMLFFPFSLLEYPLKEEIGNE